MGRRFERWEKALVTTKAEDNRAHKAAAPPSRGSKGLALGRASRLAGPGPAVPWEIAKPRSLGERGAGAVVAARVSSSMLRQALMVERNAGINVPGINSAQDHPAVHGGSSADRRRWETNRSAPKLLDAWVASIGSGFTVIGASLEATSSRRWEFPPRSGHPSLF